MLLQVLLMVFAGRAYALVSTTPTLPSLLMTPTVAAPSVGITISVTDPPIETQDVRIVCNVAHRPDGSAIEWEYNLVSVDFLSEAYHEGRVDVEDGDSTSTLVIRRSDRCDAGLYSCCVGAECAEEYVEIEEAPQVISDPTAPAVLREGEQISLQCGATGVPTPQITWLRNSQTLSADARYAILIDNSTELVDGQPVDVVSNLTITSLSDVDGGQYQCNVSNSHGWSTSLSARIAVVVQNVSRYPVNCLHPPDNWTLSCSDVASLKRLPAVLDIFPNINPGDQFPVYMFWNGWTCFRPSRCPLLHFTWKICDLVQQGSMLVIGGKCVGHGLYSQPVDKRIELHSYPGMHMIELTVESPADKASTVARSLLLIDDESHVEQSASHLLHFSSARSGNWQTDSSTGILTVDWSGHFYNSYINSHPWLLYPVNVPSSVLNVVRYPLSFDGVKTAHDSGVLEFSVSLSQMISSEVYEPIFSPVLLGPLTDSYSFPTLNLTSGLTFRADIAATDIFGHQENSSVLVFTDFTPPLITKHEIWQRSQPSIKDCKARTALGGNHYSLEFTVSDAESGVHHVDWIVDQIDGKQVGKDTVPNPESVSKAECRSPSCSCSLDDFCSSHDMTVELSSLTANSYDVTLVATSRSGLVNRTTVQLSIKTENIPLSLTSVQEISSSAIKAWWSSVPGAIGYTLTACPQDSGGGCRMCVDTRSTSSPATVTGLSPFTNYLVQVQVDTNSSSSLSNIRNRRTEAAPPPAPENVTATAVNSTAIQVQWSPADHRNGIITGYKVMVSGGGRFGEKPIDDTSNRRVIHVIQLLPFTSYSVQIAATTTGGTGDYSLATGVRTHEAVPGGPPRNIHFSMVRSSSLTFTWMSPEKDLQNGIILGYNISYQPQTGDETPITISFRDLGKLNITLENLQPYTSYIITVAAFTSIGPGVKAEVTHRTAEDVPEAPQIDERRLNALGTSSFSITWLPPDRPNGVLIQFVIVVKTSSRLQRRDITNSSTTLEYYAKATDTHYVVTGLVPGVKYGVSMMGETKQGRGAETKTFNVTTMPLQLGAPPDLVATGNGSRRIRVQWKHPSTSSLAQLTYDVTYYRIVDDSNARDDSESLPTSNTSILLTELKPYSYYRIDVAVMGTTGNTSTTFAYTDEDRPEEVAEFDVDDVEASSFRLEWKPPLEANGRIGYRYKLQDTVSGRPAEVVTIALSDLEVIGGKFRYIVGSLDGDTTYHVSVFAYNLKLNIDGDLSHTEIVQTEIGISGPPSNVMVNATDYTTILVSWDPPDQPNGALSGYEIRRARVSSGSSQSDPESVTYEVADTSRFYEITNAYDGTSYEVTVRAVNQRGRGEGSSPKTVTAKYIPPGRKTPTDVLILNVTSTGFVVTWQAPNDTTGLQNYTVTVTNVDTQMSLYFETRKLNRFIRVDNLVSYSLYQVMVSASYMDQTIEQSPPRFNQTLQGRPTAPPNSFSVEATGNSTVLLQWLSPSPQELHGRLCRFQVVAYHQLQKPKIFKSFEARHRSGNLMDLAPWTEYNISIAAETCGGEGGVGPFVSALVQTEEGVPEITAFDEDRATPQSVTLMWQINPNGNLTMMEIGRNNNGSSLRPLELVESGTYTWRDLTPNKLYEFVFRAATSMGMSVKTVSARTAESVPTSSPNLVRCTSHLSNNDSLVFLNLDFYNIPRDDWNGMPQSYHFAVYQSSNDTGSPVDVRRQVEDNITLSDYYDTEQQTHTEHFKLEKLNSSLGQLSISLAGSTLAGRGPYSEQCLFKVPKSSPPGVVQQAYSSGSDDVGIALAVVFPFVAVIIAIIILIFFWRRSRLRKATLRQSHELEYLTGAGGSYMTHWLGEWPDYETLQFDRSKLEIIGDLGEGEFGKVHLAVAMGIIPTEEKTKVAVKTLKGGSSKESATDFKKELEIMMEFDHPKIIKLLGVCTKEEPLYLITELMSEGDLKEFVRKARPSEANPVPRLSLYQLLDICSQVASGMAYLASVRFVHRDIAARNCLVGGDDTELIAKVADFGMAKDVYQSDYYKKRGGILPVRWMAPEAITDGRHTVYSDIWSFGVLMWEVFSFGYQPYFGIENDRVLGGVIGGKLRLQCPPGCPAVVYALMDRCWQKKPEERITASDLSHEMLGLVKLCKENGPDAVKQQAVDRYQSLKRFKSTAAAPGKDFKPMTSATDEDHDGYLKPTTKGMPEGSSSGYTPIASFPGQSESHYEKRMKPDAAATNTAEASTEEGRHFDNPVYCDPSGGYDYPPKRQMAPQTSYMDMATTLPRDGVYDSPHGQGDVKGMPKQDSYMDMTSTLPKDGVYDSPQGQKDVKGMPKQDSYMDMTSTLPKEGVYDSPQGQMDVKGMSKQDSYMDMSSTLPKDGVYDSPHGRMDLKAIPEQESYIDMASTLPQDKKPMRRKETYLDMSDPPALGDYDNPVDLQPTKEPYVDMGSGETKREYDDPLMWVLGKDSKGQSYVDMSSGTPLKETTKESYVEMDASPFQSPFGAASDKAAGDEETSLKVNVSLTIPLDHSESQETPL